MLFINSLHKKIFGGEIQGSFQQFSFRRMNVPYYFGALPCRNKFDINEVRIFTFAFEKLISQGSIGIGIANEK